MAGDRRGATPVVGKTLELGLAALFVSGLVATLYGGVVPDYRTAAGGQTAERVAAGVTERIERVVPPAAVKATVDRRVPVPATIRGRSYRIVGDGTTLRLEHPHPVIGHETRLAVPTRVLGVDGSWNSGATTRVRLWTTDDGVRLRLVEGTR